MSDLVTIERARDYAPGATDTQLALLVSAASRAAERYCSRRFAAGVYDELVTGTGHPSVFVQNPPIRRVVAVRTSAMPACWVTNDDTTCQAATVDVRPDRLTLTKVANGTTQTVDLTWQQYPTFAALVPAVNAAGGGWRATLADRFAGWATADLRPELGSFSARQLQAALSVHWYYLPGFQVDELAGEIVGPGGFPDAYQGVRVQYEGGYPDAPDDLQLAVCELVQLAHAQTRLNPAVQSETLDRYSYTRATEQGFERLSSLARKTLNAYRMLPVARYDV